jgi:DNA polymerase-1
MLAVADQLAGHPDPAAVDGFEMIAAGQQRALARSGRADDAHHAAGRHVQVDIPQHLPRGAADIIKRAMVRLPKALHEAGLTARLLLRVHDELLFEAPVAGVPALSAVAKQVMESAATLSVPLVVETGSGRTWANAH